MTDFSQTQWFDRLDQLQQQLQESQTRLRHDMTEGFHLLAMKADVQAQANQAIADRVLVIEIERRQEAQQLVRRATVIGVLSVAALTAAWAVIEHVLGWR